GITLGGAYCDELTLFPRDFFVMLLSRLSVSGAKLIATTNPDTPSHWLLKEYLANDDLSEDIFRMVFLIDDNTTLDPEYVAALKKEYTGIFYDRFILGLWKAAEGVIYRDFANDTERYLLDALPDDLMLGVCGLDFGGNGSAHAAALVGITRGFKRIVVLEEYYRKEVIDPETLTDDVCEFITRCKSRYRLGDMYCDSAETTLVKGIRTAVHRRKIPVEVHNARKGEIIDRIWFCSMMMAQGRFFVMRHCKHTIEALTSCVWDSRSLNDKRLDDGSSNIDSLDALEYALEPYMSDLIEVRK
ncbi:MAG: terminase family protein, partial [Oscillospiraceae bacterium]|nr:terminase family protein [Oscillospiraceae bacterium]